MDLFDQHEPFNQTAPLAERVRPQHLDEVIGQQHLIGPGKLLRQLIEQDQLTSLILWGPPGTGKTTLARVISQVTRSRFVFYSAVLGSVKEIRTIVAAAKEERRHYGRRTLLFVDEIHRFNKAQQDAFLPHVEQGDITLIGATTENPSFEVNAALLSRSRVFVLEPLSQDDLVTLLRRTLDSAQGLDNVIKADEEALLRIAQHADGDARLALTSLELAASVQEDLCLQNVDKVLQKGALRYDKGGDEHYNVISAFIKSVRGSDPDAALYWLARMIEAGEDPMFIARRLVILASEDIGNADPRGLQVAISAQQAVHLIGLPEGRIPLAQATTYLATAPKSNAAYVGIKQAQAEVRKSGALGVPLHLRNAPTNMMKAMDYGKGYHYAHDAEEGYIAQDHLPEELTGRRFYRPTQRGYEKTIGQRMSYWQQLERQKEDESS